VRELGNTHMMT